MASRRSEAKRLRAAVAAERSTVVSERPTRASDQDLQAVDRLLEQAASADAPSERQALRGRISRAVMDTWSFDAPLSDSLVAFDDRFLVP